MRGVCCVLSGCIGAAAMPSYPADDRLRWTIAHRIGYPLPLSYDAPCCARASVLDRPEVAPLSRTGEAHRVRLEKINNQNFCSYVMVPPGRAPDSVYGWQDCPLLRRVYMIDRLSALHGCALPRLSCQ